MSLLISALSASQAFDQIAQGIRHPAYETTLFVLFSSNLPLEKKKKIVDALHRLSVKYRPYVDALMSELPK